MIVINSFSRGLVTNIEGVSRPWETAQYLRDCRTNELGFLIPRPGRTRISTQSGFVAIFQHKNVLLAVMSGGVLKWARIRGIGEQVEFQDFNPRVVVIQRQGGHIQFSARDNKVFLMSGGDPIVIDIPSTGTPTASAFYLPTAAAPEITYSEIGRADGRDFDSRHIKLRLQYVLLSESQADLEEHQGAYPGQRRSDVYDLLADRSVLSHPSESVRIDISTEDTDGAFNDLSEADALTARTTVEISLSETLPAGAYVDVYRSERDTTPDDESEEDWYWTARFPADVNTLTYTFEHNDDGLTGYPGLIYVSDDNPNLQYLTTNEFRSYGASLNSNRIWLSYYDAAKNERFYQSLTDTIDLDLGEGYITGLKFIRDNLLIVYATNQIQVIATDPIAELHRVIDFISPQDDKGNPIGCIAPQTIVDMGGIHWFLAANQYVYEYNSRSARTMSDLVYLLFQTMARPIDNNGQPELSKAVAFAYNKDYYISIPSRLEENSTDEPNTTLLYQPQYARWWQDSFGIRSVTKSNPERVYAIIGGQLFEIYEGIQDDNAPVRRVWRNNPYPSPTQNRFESVHVYPQAAALIDIKAITEQETFETDIDVIHPADIFSCKAGCNLRGRLLQVEISTESTAVIDRITTNEDLRNQ